MTEQDLLQTNDAYVWAQEFIRRKKDNDWSLDDIDEGLMIGWFANAMAAQEMKDAQLGNADDGCGGNPVATDECS